MLKKIDRSKSFLAKCASLFRCPFCHTRMKRQEYGMYCEKGHRFDLSKKGTLFFLKQAHASSYIKEMFAPRGRLIRSGMYEPVIRQIKDGLDPQTAILDVGCGEGSFLAELQREEKFPCSIGFDLSKEGIYLASNLDTDSFWCVADLTNLPFADHSFNYLLNIFSPSHYQEFNRVLKDEGTLIKVIPEKNYLKELRKAFYPDEEQKQNYSNQQVLRLLSEKMKIISENRLTYLFEIPQELRLDLLEMSPLEWGVPAERKQFLKENPLSKITIDVRVINAKKK